ncbi:hypothetical protein [Paraglaciecola sp.]|uniref:hypothetical protein n=1 Tax=Paraglaciecola sp. TaxID=1920173 RepID=UPI003EF11D24
MTKSKIEIGAVILFMAGFSLFLFNFDLIFIIKIDLAGVTGLLTAIIAIVTAKIIIKNHKQQIQPYLTVLKEWNENSVSFGYKNSGQGTAIIKEAYVYINFERLYELCPKTVVINLKNEKNDKFQLVPNGYNDSDEMGFSEYVLHLVEIICNLPVANVGVDNPDVINGFTHTSAVGIDKEIILTKLTFLGDENKKLVLQTLRLLIECTEIYIKYQSQAKEALYCPSINKYEKFISEH